MFSTTTGDDLSRRMAAQRRADQRRKTRRTTAGINRVAQATFGLRGDL